MIDDRCPFPYSSVEDDTTSLVSLNVIGSAEGFIQYLQHFHQLSILELATELVIHRSPHNTTHHDAIVEPLLISVLYRTLCIQGRLLQCRIYQHIQDLLILQDYLQFLIPAIKLDPVNLSLSNSDRSDKVVPITT